MYKDVTLETCLDLLRKNKIVIYGTGYVGKKCLQALKKLGLESQILGYAKSTQALPQECIDGISVRCISELAEYKDCLFCVAVHSSIKDEVIEELERHSLNNYIWIYPYLYRILLGKAVQENVMVETSALWEHCRTDYRMAIRWLALEQYLGMNDDGYELYIKAESLHCSKETAHKRLHQFCDLIDTWMKSGYDSEHKILITEDYEIIDGNHRASLAMYFGVKYLKCDVFSLPDGVLSIQSEETMLSLEVLQREGFTEEEIDRMNQVIAHMNK